MITSIDHAYTGSASILVYPNPVEQLVTIRVNEENNAETTFIISDALGKKIVEGKIKKEIIIDMSTWGPGVYLLETTDGVNQGRQKIVRQ